MYCNRCGHNLEDGATFCKYCGQKLLATTEITQAEGMPPRRTRKRRKSRKGLAAVVVLVCLLIAGAVGGTVVYLRADKDVQDKQMQLSDTQQEEKGALDKTDKESNQTPDVTPAEEDEESGQEQDEAQKDAQPADKDDTAPQSGEVDADKNTVSSGGTTGSNTNSGGGSTSSSSGSNSAVGSGSSGSAGSSGSSSSGSSSSGSSSSGSNSSSGSTSSSTSGSTSSGSSSSGAGTGATSSTYVIADSNSRYLTAEELDRFTAAELRLARNEIYARHGRLFNDSYLQNYFNNKTWYHGTISPASFDDSVFNAYEQANLDTIVAVESSRGS